MEFLYERDMPEDIKRMTKEELEESIRQMLIEDGKILPDEIISENDKQTITI